MNKDNDIDKLVFGIGIAYNISIIKIKRKETDMDREIRLTEVRKAVEEGRAYLDTHLGKRLVVGYNDETGWTVTNNGKGYWDQKSFMVCLENILITEKPIIQEKTVVKHDSFTFEGKTVPVTSIETDRIYNWE